MKKTEMEIFSEEINSPVIRIVGRKFPGVLIQGDTLKNLLSLVEEICEVSKKEGAEETQEIASELKNILVGHVASYEKTLKAHNLELPYPKKMDH
jgi:predicted RNase H-like HicB family nuclease